MKHKKSIHSLLFTAATTALTAAAQEVTYIQTLTQSSTLWNQAILTKPSLSNSISISPDSAWLYVTSVTSGTLSKLHPITGKFVSYYDDDGGESGETFVYGQGGIEFYLQDENNPHNNNGGGNNTSGTANTATSYLLYWTLQVSQAGGYYSNVICVHHDPNPNSNTIEIKWIATLGGVLSGMPKIGSDGKLIYLTINADADTPLFVNTTTNNNDDVTATTDTTNTTTDGGAEEEGVSPTTDEGSSITNQSDGTTNTSSYWFLDYDDNNNKICKYGEDFPEVSVSGTTVTPALFETRDECCLAQPSACVETLTDSSSNSTTTTSTNNTTSASSTNDTLAATATTGEPSESSSSGGSTNDNMFDRRRKLQEESPKKSGRFIILNADNGNVIYSFDSQSDFTITNHNFGPVGIAHSPQYGNYNGGEDNTNDVIMWGSSEGQDGGGGDSGGETLLFQLPMGFNADTLLSSSSIDVTELFETRVMESVSWTTETPPTFSKDGLSVYFIVSGHRLTGWNNGQQFDVAPNVGPVDLSSNDTVNIIQRPIVLVEDDMTLLVGVQDTMYGVDVSRNTATISWKLDNFGSGAAFTTPQITPDGNLAYFGKSGALHALNVTAGGGKLLWEDTNGYVDPFTNESQITMADFSIDSTGQTLYYCRGGSSTITALQIGEMAPTIAPSPIPSMSPSETVSTSPSTSVVPSTSMVPTHNPEFNFPSTSPSETLSPTRKPTVSPTKSLFPTILPVQEPAFMLPGSPDQPTSDTSGNSPSSLSSSTSPLTLSTPAIIGIAVGGGVGLILLLGVLYYVCRKKPCSGGGEDDGVDMEWQASNANRQFQGSASGGEGQTPFQYGDEEQRQRYGDEPLKW